MGNKSCPVIAYLTKTQSSKNEYFVEKIGKTTKNVHSYWYMRIPNFIEIGSIER